MVKGMNNPENNVLVVFASREITTLYKTLLEIIEDIKKDQGIMLQKVAQKNGQDFADQINPFTPEKNEHIRKRILDVGNECSRKMVSFFDFFDFTINKDKVAEAAKQKRMIVKKFITSSPLIVE